MFEFFKSFRKRENMLLSEAVEFAINSLEVERRSMNSTGGNYIRAMRMLVSHVGDIEVGSVTPGDMESLVESMKAGRKQATIVNYYSNLKAIFRRLQDMGHIKANPCQLKLTDKRVITDKPRVTMGEMQLMIEGTVSIRDEAILRIQKDSAGRADEIRRMRKSTTIIRHFYISDEGNRVWVHHNDTIPNGKKLQMIGVSEVEHPKRQGGYLKFSHDACVALIRYLNTRRFSDLDYIWLSKQSKHIGRTSFYMVYRAAGKRVGIDKHRCSPHKWRHGVAIHMRKNNAEFADIADLLRHKNVALTIREYGQLTESEKVERYLDVTSGLLQNRPNIPDDLSGIFR